MKSLASTGIKWNRVMLGVAAAILLAIVWLSYRAWLRYSRANLEVAHSQQVTESIETLLTRLLDAEAGQRGYLLTGNNQYLVPYDSAVQSVPIEMANLERLLASRPGESGMVVRLGSLVNQRLEELRQTIDLRRKEGVTPAMDVILSGEGERTMDEVRRLCRNIRLRNNLSQSEASRNGEAAARIALLVTTFGSLILLFFFVAGVEPLVSGDPEVKHRPRFLIYVIPVLVTLAATALRMVLNPIMGGTAEPFITFFPAVLFAAWYGGLQVGALTLLLSALVSNYYFAQPVGSFLVRNPSDQVGLLLFIIVGSGMAFLSHSQRRALERADREAARRGEAENAEREQRQQLQKSNESLARLNKDLESFAFVASHDLQEPLRMITAYAQLLVKTYSAQLDQDATLYVGNIVEGARRMRELVRDLLAYMEIGAHPEGSMEPVDLNRVLEAIQQNLKLAIEESGAVITCDHLPTLDAYPNHLVPLFQNLVGNAIKYRNNAPPRIHISVEECDGQWQFRVSDNGLGIDPEHHTKIFEAFKRLHGKEIRGTGVGLAICQRIVERYGGRIWVESQLGQGAKFLFTLPVSAPRGAL